MNIIIAGDGEVGFYLAKILSGDKHNITIVDPHSDLLKMIESQTDILTITGDSTSIEVLESANIKKADLLISVLHEEKVNLITAILGKKLGAKRTIARINNKKLLGPKARGMFRELGIDELVYPESIAANEIIKLLQQAAATEFFEFSNGLLSLFLIKLDENAPVIGKTLNQIVKENPHLDFRAVAIHRSPKTIIPKGQDKFQAGDMAYVITKPSGIDNLLRLGGKENIEIKNVMIIGASRIGQNTAMAIEGPMNVKIIDNDKERCNQLTNTLNNSLIIHGDARDVFLLEEEGLGDMDAFIAVTDNSETNILTCLYAKKYGVKKAIALVENIEFIDISQNVNVDTIINKKLVTASYIARFTMNAEVMAIKCLTGVDAEVMEFVAKPGSSITKDIIKNLKFPEGAIIGGIIRGNEGFIATGEFHIKEHDRVVVFSIPQSIPKVQKYFS